METELKLTLEAGQVTSLLAHPLLGTATQTQRLLNTYFDTPALDLKARSMAVRERMADQQWLLTVKTAGTSTGGLSRRLEWEGPTTPGALDFAKLVSDLELANTLMALRGELKALFCTDFERQRWILSHADASIEVALDQGTITVPGADASEPILELELELLNGPEAALLSLAEVLRKTPTQSLALTPSDASKAQRGMALWALTR